MAEGRRGMSMDAPRKQLRSSSGRSSSSMLPPESPRTRASVSNASGKALAAALPSCSTGKPTAPFRLPGQRSSQPFKKRYHPPINVTAGQGRFQKRWRTVLESQPEEEDDDDEDDDDEDEEEDEEEDEGEADKGKVYKRPRRRGKNIETLLEAVAKEEEEEESSQLAAAGDASRNPADSSVMIVEDHSPVEVIDIAEEGEEVDAEDVTEESFREMRRELTQSRRHEHELAEDNRQLRMQNELLEKRCAESAADLDSLGDDVQCPVCLTLPREPQSCPRGHSICLECRQQVRLCPTCRTPMLRDSNNFLLKKIVHSVLMHACRNDLRGCDVRVKLGELAAHEARCSYRDVYCPSCYDNIPMRLLQRHLSDPPSCYLQGKVYLNPKGVTMSESGAEEAHLEGLTNVFKWKPLTLSYDGRLCFVCCFLRSDYMGKSLTIQAVTDACEEDCAGMYCCVTVGRSKKEFLEPHGRKVTETLRLKSVDRRVHPDGVDNLFVNEKSYSALIGSTYTCIGVGRSRASFYLHAEVRRSLDT